MPLTLDLRCLKVCHLFLPLMQHKTLRKNYLLTTLFHSKHPLMHFILLWQQPMVLIFC